MTVYTLFLYIGLVALGLTALRYFLQDYKDILISFLQNFVGSLFIFSGFVKAVDPMGTSIKMQEYFEAMHLEFFNSFSTPFTVAMLVAELTLGVALLVGYKPKLTTSLLLLLNIFFLLLTGYTFLSGYQPTNAFFIVSILTFIIISIGGISENGVIRFWSLALGFGIIVISLGLMKFSSLLLTAPFDMNKMKVTDCGCFGDFMKLKPWQTFYKDVILSCMALILAIRNKHIKPALPPMLINIKTYFTLVASFFFCLYNFMWNEPVIDFRPYAIGEDINANMIVKKPEVRSMIHNFKNKKTGEVRVIKNEDYMKLGADEWTKLANDYTDERKDIVLDEGIPARISNLNISNEDGIAMNDTLLHDKNYSLMIVAPLLDETHEDVFTTKLNPLAQACDKAGIRIFAMTKDLDKAEAFRHKLQTAYPFYTTDEAAIKAMMRSNPGLMLLKNGVVINKWHYMHLPTFDDLNSMYFSKK